MLFLGLVCITFGIVALSSGLGSPKRVILEFFLQCLLYKDSEIEVKKPILKQAEISLVQILDPDPLQFQR